ncbi:NLR family CARD domain-containing protein 4-like [Diadema setosum]|uniref:NLR family CARD domain-containing protein 4-like n=1 Tax=Diadema setosum TaxID=31175 RepID=UPI003B3A0DEE
MDRRFYLVLLLTLTTNVFCGHYGEASVVGTVPNVQGWKGEDMLLRCDIKEEPLDVYWEKEDFLNPEQKTRKAEYFDGHLKSLEERFDIDKNFSLVISSLEVADEGRYYCQVLLKNSQSFENSTIMTISSMASGHTIEECAERSQSRQSRCTYQSPSNTPSLNLTCVVSGFKPNISMLWTEESRNRLYSVVSQQNTLSDGTNERFETITVSAEHEREQTLVCVATGDSLNGTSTREITVLPISVSDKHVNSGLIIGLTIGVPLALLILVGKYLSSKHPEYLPRKGSSSLTNEQVQRCKEELKAYYRMTRRKVRVDPFEFMELVELDDIYTNLSIIERKSRRKIPMEYNDLLTKVENGDLSNRLLFQGEGGAGKTTLCAKIAWDWCQGRIFKDIDMVIVIPLRDITTETSIGGIVKYYLSYSNTSASQIDNYISANQNKVLIIFDGFDEFNEELSEKSSSEVIRILRIQEYNSCKVIVTTRPWRTDEFTMYKNVAEAYTFLSVEGFNEENLSAYIRRYFRIKEKDSLAENLIRFMEENYIIRSNMAPFPIYCAMLCLMWNDFCEERRKEMQKLHTFSKIFREMISFLKEHYASKVCVNLQSQETVAHLNEAGRAIQEISEIALQGLFDRYLSFPEEQFRECHDAMVTCCRVGVLTVERYVITRERRRVVNVSSLVTSTVSFPHKLFQEYIAGVYIQYLFANDRAKYDKVKNKLLSRPEEFRYVLYFTSASGNELGLDIIKGLINCPTHKFTSNSFRYKENDKRDFCVDIAFECHTEEAARAVGEGWDEYKLDNSSKHTVSGVVFMVCYNQVQSLEMYGMTCGRTVSRDLAEGMCSSSLFRKVSLSYSKFHVEFYKILRAEASKCLQ